MYLVYQEKYVLDDVLKYTLILCLNCRKRYIKTDTSKMYILKSNFPIFLCNIQGCISWEKTETRPCPTLVKIYKVIS